MFIPDYCFFLFLFGYFLFCFCSLVLLSCVVLSLQNFVFVSQVFAVISLVIWVLSEQWFIIFKFLGPLSFVYSCFGLPTCSSSYLFFLCVCLVAMFTFWSIDRCSFFCLISIWSLFICLILVDCLLNHY